MDSKQEVLALLKKEIKQEVTSLLEVPPDPSLGDYALPCFTLAKTYKKAPQDIAKDLAKKISSPLFDKVEAKGPYLNLFLNKKKLTQSIVNEVLKQQQKYGNSTLGKGKTVVMDISSPNIAKAFGIGHLRSTIIGNAIHHCLASQGYNVVRVNHLGDWGTQFGKLITAYKKWGKEKELAKDPIKYLLNLYVKFHQEAEKNQELEDEARDWFKKLEQGNQEARKLWKRFRDLSIQDFKNIYKLLGVKFESYEGEAFYNDKMEPVIKELKAKKLLELSEGAWIVNLEKYKMPPALIMKKDGATLYLTRDLAAAFYRKKIYKADKLVYEVGSEQKLHFQQLFKIIELMGYSWAKDCVHINHGLYLDQDRKKLSTRKGKTIFMEEVINEAISEVKKVIQEKNPALKNKEKVAHAVGVGAIIFGDVMNDRTNDIVFDMDKFLSFDGETGPYLQYTHARLRSILRKGKPSKKINLDQLDHDEVQLIKHLGNFQQTIQESNSQYKPSILARYLLDLAQATNTYYVTHPILKSEEPLRSNRLTIISAVQVVLKKGLQLLNMEPLEEM
jgi:arginyl-tRNA synthetase